MSRSMRIWLAVALAGALAVATPMPSQAAGTTLRSGTIVTGWQPMAPHRGIQGMVADFDGCRNSLECRAWLKSGCNQALVGRNPAVMTSIVDVSGINDGRTYRAFDTYSRAGIRWGLTIVQFYSPRCREMRSRQVWRRGWWAGAQWFEIPASARWMTVSSSQDNVNMRWTLSAI
jgi:hypothetical protein